MLGLIALSACRSGARRASAPEPKPIPTADATVEGGDDVPWIPTRPAVALSTALDSVLARWPKAIVQIATLDRLAGDASSFRVRFTSGEQCFEAVLDPSSGALRSCEERSLEPEDRDLLARIARHAQAARIIARRAIGLAQAEQAGSWAAHLELAEGEREPEYMVVTVLDRRVFVSQVSALTGELESCAEAHSAHPVEHLAP